MKFKPFWKKTAVERAKDHIQQLGKHYASGNLSGRRDVSTSKESKEDILKQIEYEEMMARLSAKEGGVKGWEYHMKRAKELKRLLGV